MKNKIPSKAIILVGGLGTRLHPLTFTMPKPLVPFCNKPMLYYQIEKFSKIGIKVFILALNYYSEMIINNCKEYEKEFGIEIIYSIEKIELGTGGPLGLAKKYLEGGSFFVLNSDILCDIDLNEMINKYVVSECSAVIMTYLVDDPARYGLIKYEGDKIVYFEEKPKCKREQEGRWMINGGLYIFSESILDLIEPKKISLENEIFTNLARQNEMVFYEHKGYWADIGKFEDYLLGQEMYLRSLDTKEERIENNKCDNLVKIAERSLIGKNIRFGQNIVIKKNTVIGDNVIIGDNVVFENCTVFSNTVIGSNCVIKDSVIGWNCKIGENCQILKMSVLGKSVMVDSNTNLNTIKIS